MFDVRGTRLSMFETSDVRCLKHQTFDVRGTRRSMFESLNVACLRHQKANVWSIKFSVFEEWDVTPTLLSSPDGHLVLCDLGDLHRTAHVLPTPLLPFLPWNQVSDYTPAWSESSYLALTSRSINNTSRDAAPPFNYSERCFRIIFFCLESNLITCDVHKPKR